jgi:hypothetical protein
MREEEEVEEEEEEEEEVEEVESDQRAILGKDSSGRPFQASVATSVPEI